MAAHSPFEYESEISFSGEKYEIIKSWIGGVKRYQISRPALIQFGKKLPLNNGDDGNKCEYNNVGTRANNFGENIFFVLTEIKCSSLLLKNGPTRASFCLFLVFSNNQYNFYNKSE